VIAIAVLRVRTALPHKRDSSLASHGRETWRYRVNEMAAGFNGRQKEYKVTAVYKGFLLPRTLTAEIDRFRAKKAPHIVQVCEVGNDK